MRDLERERDVDKLEVFGKAVVEAHQIILAVFRPLGLQWDLPVRRDSARAS